ncbi:NfeD family protein [Chloroflexota bacterium]
MDNEEWRARAEERIEKGETIVVTAISGITLNVEKFKGGKLEEDGIIKIFLGLIAYLSSNVCFLLSW